MNTYQLGSSVRFTGSFTDEDDLPVDPDTVSLVIRDPSGNETVYTYLGLGTITRTAIGEYYQDAVVDEHGVWYYQWKGTGTATAIDEDALYCAVGEIV